MQKIVSVDVNDSRQAGKGTSSMEVFLFEPQGDGPHPAIVLAQHIPVGHTGVENDTFTLVTAERYCNAGFVVAVPFIFHWWPKSEEIAVKRDESRDELMIADMQATYQLLSNHEQVDANRIGVIGHCWGGRVAWLGACTSGFAACAIFYGGRIKLTMGEGNPAPITRAADISCPVIGFFGNQDQNPTPEDVDDYDSALTTAGVPHTFYRYENAGHAFQNFPTPERYRETESEDAWKHVLNFLDNTLKQTAR